jgi:hypothetical protein
LVVIPAKAGTHFFQGFLDSRFRGSDGGCGFFSTLVEDRAVLCPEKLVTLSRLEKVFPEIPPARPFSKRGELLGNSTEGSSLFPFGKGKL